MSSVDYQRQELTHACSRSDTDACDMIYTKITRISSMTYHRYDVTTYIYVRIGLILIYNVVYKDIYIFYL